MPAVVVVVAGMLVLLGLASGWLQRTPISAPMVVLGVGIAFGPGFSVLPTDLASGGVLVLAEVSLAILLFVDATRVDLSLVRRNGGIPGRMLLLGLPLAIGLGTAAGVGVLGLAAGPAFVLACLLAPTDAALGQAVMGDERVPARIRQAINVESGLNDGLVVPFLTVALVVVEARAGSAGDGALLLEALRPATRLGRRHLDDRAPLAALAALATRAESPLDALPTRVDGIAEGVSQQQSSLPHVSGCAACRWRARGLLGDGRHDARLPH